MPGRGSAFASAFSPRATAVTLLQRSKYWFELSFAGNNQNFPAEAAQTVKLITIFMPEFLANGWASIVLSTRFHQAATAPK